MAARPEAHTDYGNVTLLANRQGRRPASWPKPPGRNGSKRLQRPRRICLQYRDCLMRWSNDTLRPRHRNRVRPPEQERYSIALTPGSKTRIR